MRRCHTVRKQKKQVQSTEPESNMNFLDNCRVAIFIDGSNLYHALEQSCGRSDLNFASFIKWLTQNHIRERNLKNKIK